MIQLEEEEEKDNDIGERDSRFLQNALNNPGARLRAVPRVCISEIQREADKIDEVNEGENVSLSRYGLNIKDNLPAERRIELSKNY